LWPKSTQRGGKAAAVSGGFIQLLDPIRSELQLDFAAANTLGVSEGMLTGEVVGEIVNRQAKADYLLQWAASCGLNASEPLRLVTELTT
jgi:phosphoserine phosphatase